jgi:hypothetical protein
MATDPVVTKPATTVVWYKSKTLWTNVGLFALDVLNGAYGAIDIPPDVRVGVVVVVNLLLRLVSSGSIVRK